jgi:hypothetical protein
VKTATTENGQILRLFHPFQFPERDREIRRNLRMAPVNKTAKGSAKFVVDPTCGMKWRFHHMESDLLLLPKWR